MRATHDRAKILARAESRGRIAPSGAPSDRSVPVSRNLGARASTVPARIGYAGVRRHGNKTRYAGSGDAGYRSEWAKSRTFWTDPAWSRTVSA